MRLRLGRREVVRLGPYTGRTFCGCRWFYGYRMIACDDHRGRHRESEERG